jgi:hypothetical protein
LDLIHAFSGIVWVSISFSFMVLYLVVGVFISLMNSISISIFNTCFHQCFLDLVSVWQLLFFVLNSKRLLSLLVSNCFLFQTGLGLVDLRCLLHSFSKMLLH